MGVVVVLVVGYYCRCGIVSALMGAGCGIREGVCAFSSGVVIGGQMSWPLAVNNDLSLTPAS